MEAYNTVYKSTQNCSTIGKAIFKLFTVNYLYMLRRPAEKKFPTH